MEKRALKHHRGRVGDALREEIETLVEGELADPRIGLVSVTAVQVADDGRSAEVWVNVEGDDNEADQSLEGLEAAREYIRHELVERLRIRRAPELYFRLDRAEEAFGFRARTPLREGLVQTIAWYREQVHALR